MKKYKLGTKLKRKFEDYAEVEIIGIMKEYTILKDTSGRHFVKTEKLSKYFSEIEKEDITNTIQDHKNIDDPFKHNIAQTMNGPSLMQKKAFEKLQKD